MKLLYFPGVLSVVCLFALWGCENRSYFGYSIEGTEPAAPPILTEAYNPYDPLVPEPDPDATVHTDSFTQSGEASKVDIVFMIDDSGSMDDNQNAIRENASRFTDQLINSLSDDFRLIVITSNVTSNVSTNPRLQNQCGSYVTKSNAADFADCAVVGTSGDNSGREEGLEAVRRALDPNYPSGPWNTGATPSPLNDGFLRDDADLHIVYVSDEEDEPDDRAYASSSWNGKGPTEADVTALRKEMYFELADGGHWFDQYYAFFPLLADHVSFLESLKNGPKVRAHAIVMTSLDVEGSDACHTRRNTEEVGQRYITVANLTGGSVSDVCSDWSETMDQLGLQVSGLDRCFRLDSIPTDRSSIAVQIDGADVPSDAYVFVPIGNRVCFDTLPAAGAEISITYH